ncbi:MAG: hypothetical protein IJR07_08435 [Bacteroidaceae bacterium]|nr:hypothetical protein [Bacteroidaceae bacterium]
MVAKTSGNYWSSSENNATNAWNFNFNSTNRRFNNNNKTNANNVRPVFAYRKDSIKKRLHSGGKVPAAPAATIAKAKARQSAP